MTAFVIPEPEWNTLSARFVTLAGMKMSRSPLQLSNARSPIRRTLSGIRSVLNHDLLLNADEPTAVTGYDTPPDSTDDGNTKSSGPVPEYPVKVASPSATENCQFPSVNASD